jgi:hypothetical protein
MWFTWQFRYYILVNGRYTETQDDVCVEKQPPEWENVLTSLVRSRGAWAKLIEELSKKQLLHLASLLSVAMCLLTLVGVLSLVLIFSFRFTLWILTRVAATKVSFALLVFLDIVVAICLPPLLIHVALLIAALTSMVVAGGIVDYALFSDPSFGALILARAGHQLASTFLGVFLGAGFVFLSTEPILRFTFTPLALILAGQESLSRIPKFFSDTSRVMHGSLDVGYNESIVNWAMFIDLLFSTSFLVPAFIFVAASRRPMLRTMIVNLLKYLERHPRGPLVALLGPLTRLFDRIRKIGS